MLAWMLYAATVSLLLTFGALCAAQTARLRGAPARFIWAAALILSLLIPAIMSSVSVTLPRLNPASPPNRRALSPFATSRRNSLFPPRCFAHCRSLAQLSGIKKTPALVRSFFQAPSVAYITDS